MVGVDGGRYSGELPRWKVSMMIMRPPQQGRGCGSMGGSSISVKSASAALLRLPYAASDFTVLPALQAEPSAVAVRADSRFRTLRELIDAMRGSPDKLSVGGFSAGGFHQFVFYRLQQEGKFKSAWIPFKGGQEAGTALLGGHIDVAVITPSSALAQLQNGDIRLLGISSDGRDPYFPDVPTFKEQGLGVVERILAQRHAQGRHAAAGDRNADLDDRQDEADPGVEGFLAPQPAVFDGDFPR